MKCSLLSKNPGKIDIRSVASHACVSIATVSRTINYAPTVDPRLASRVWKAVKELNYSPNTQARALASGKSKLLGLIVSEITNPFFPELIQEFEDEAIARGYDILLGCTNYEPEKMQVCVRRMLGRKVDGVAIMTFGVEESMLECFATENIPFVSIDTNSERAVSIAITVDYRSGIYEGVRHLAVLGHRDIGFIGGPLRMPASEARKLAFLDSLRAVGIRTQPSWLIEGDDTCGGGRDAMKDMLKLSERPTAIMCSNDMTAIGVQHALFESHLSVPRDFSLIGFDDIRLAEYTIPPLTTVRLPCKELALSAIKCLLSELQPYGTNISKSSKIATRLIVRQTTGLPRRALGDLRQSSRQSGDAVRIGAEGLS
jgi:DNA-binding LacI/PurR family transcriptional regulator